MSDTNRLTKVPNSYIMCSVQTHQELLKVAHLFPENCFIGQREVLPGVLAGGQKHPKSGGEDVSLLHPFLILHVLYVILKSVTSTRVVN